MCSAVGAHPGVAKVKKKDHIIKAAGRLFAEQGFEATTTLQITKEAGATEPLLYYHFSGKDELFFTIIAATFDIYFTRLGTLDRRTRTQFEKIEDLIALHFDLVKEMPDEIYLVVSTCPARLKDAGDVCRTNIEKQRAYLNRMLTDCLETGIASGEFHPVPVVETVNLIIAMINGLLRQRGLKLEEVKGMKAAAVAFCRRSLVKGEPLIVKCEK